MTQTTPTVPSDTLLLCLDMQPVFVDAIANGPGVLARCTFATSASVGLGVPVAFTEQAPTKLGGTAAALLAAAPTAPRWGKTAFSALEDQVIREALLRERNVRHLLICGLETSICVYQTAISALGEGLAVTLLSDCLAARRPEDAQVCVATLQSHGAHLLPSETVFYSLIHDAAHPFFREFTRLVKHHSPAVPPGSG